MKICFLTKEFIHGGAQRQLVLLAKALADRRHEVTVALFYGGGQMEAGLAGTSVTILDLGKRGRWDLAGFLWRSVSRLRRLDPDVLHSYLGTPNILSAGLRPFLPRARIVWGVRASDMDWNQYDWIAPWVFRAECRLARYADLIIVNSRKGLEHAAEHGFPPGKMRVVPNGIEVDRFRPDREAARGLRRGWGIRDDEVLVGLVSRIDPMKDHATFLRAAAKVRQVRHDVRFVCVGDGPDPYRTSVRSLASELGLDGALAWAGSRDDVPMIYNAIDIACSSSAFGEGFSNVIAEAMACGTPCVVTDVGDSAQIVGELGRVVPPRDPDAMASALLAAIEETSWKSDAASRLRRDRVASRFSITQLVERTESMLQALVESRR